MPPDDPAAPGTLEDADAAARARVDDQLGGTALPAAPAAAAPAPGQVPTTFTAPPGPPPLDIYDDEAVGKLIGDTVTYRDGKLLESEIKRAREQWRPWRDAFGNIPNEARDAILAAAPALGADLALAAQMMAHLHPDDRQFFAQAGALMATNPAQAAELFAHGAEVLRQGLGGGAPAPRPPGMPSGGDPNVVPTDWSQVDDDEPLTRGQVEAMWDERDQERQFENVVAGLEADIRAEMKTLGYDPDSQEDAEFGRVSALIALAERYDGDIQKAHEAMQARDQAIIDSFVAGKAADAGRPSSAPIVGTAPVQTTEPATLEDAEAAMRARLDGVLGPPQPRLG